MLHVPRLAALFSAVLACTVVTPLVADDPIPEGWLDGALQRIRDAEYEFSPLPGGGFSAPNRAHDLRADISGDGLTLASRTRGSAAADGGWKLELRLARYGRDGSLTSVAAVMPVVDGNRLELRRDGITEWYVNEPAGLEHGFDLFAPPKGAGNRPVVLELSLDGGLEPFPGNDGRSVVFGSSAVEVEVSYRGLLVHDATGRPLPARLVPRSASLRIELDDHGAVYPIAVDPIFTSPDWSIANDQLDARFGYSVATAGDVNGDGLSDVIIGAPQYDNGQNNEGRAYLHYGNRFGLALVAVWTFESNVPGARVGHAVAPAGDVNADGYGDVIVGAPLWNGDLAGEGAAFVFHGSAAGLSTTPDWIGEGNQTGFGFPEYGHSVAWAGDVNADGFDDVLVGAPGYWGGENGEGRVFLYLGGAGGLNSTLDWLAQSNQVDARLGQSVATAGDVNGDGYDDVIVGASRYSDVGGVEADEGTAFVWHGGNYDLGAFGTPANADWKAEADVGGAWFGTSVATAGDVNGDGYADVVVGAPLQANTPNGVGAAYAWYGGGAGLGSDGTPANADWAFADVLSSRFGHSVAPAGDLNGDGFSDVVIGAPDAQIGVNPFEGAAHVFLGSVSGLSPVADSVVESNRDERAHGSSVAAAGDVNGDGFGDLIVGAPINPTNTMLPGEARVYYGSASGPTALPNWSPAGGTQDAAFGFAIAPAGDVNGDGYQDIVVGAAGYDGGEAGEGRALVFLGADFGLQLNPAWTAESNFAGARMGASVAAAGDVNGDGFADVIVGAPDYSDFINDEGAAFVWFGGALGMGPTGDPTNADWSVFSGQFDPDFGHAVAAAGDVNGDGFGDVIVGAYKYQELTSNDGGAAFVYHGSASGPGLFPAWSGEGEQDVAWFGYDVATAGDVNGDGYSDVIVGAPLHDAPLLNEGRAYVYRGSPTGLEPASTWWAEGDLEDARMGHSVATAGDVDNNRFSDVVVGAYHYHNPDLQEGAAFVWLGSPNGLGSLGTPANAAWSVEGDRAGAQLGFDVASAGDVNADGFGDILVGADLYRENFTGEGAAWLYLGSPVGPSPSAAWSKEGEREDARYGAAVGAADVNGDGFDDVLVGAPGYESTLADEGRCFMYFGNSVDGLDRAPLQLQGDLSAPLGHRGRSTDTDQFAVRASARSAAGRGDVRLAWEVAPLGVALVGDLLDRDAQFVDSGAPVIGPGSVVTLTSGLPLGLPGVFYHWRARVETRSPFFPHGPWLSARHNGWSVTDLRTAGCNDVDGDGWGAPPDALCAQPLNGDCDDGDAFVFPGAPPYCDGINNNCLAPDWPVVAETEIDDDFDGVPECFGDCDDNDPEIWGIPGEALDLVLFHEVGSGTTTLSWSPPLQAGTTFPLIYDTVSSEIPGDFLTSPPAACVTTDDTSTRTTDVLDPAPSTVVYFLVVAQNDCGRGIAGFGAGGARRPGALECP